MLPLRTLPFTGLQEESPVSARELCKPALLSTIFERSDTEKSISFGEPSPNGTAESPTFSDTSTEATSTKSRQWEEKTCESEEPSLRNPCPIVGEFHKARAHHRVLTSTGCTKDFCQAGRAIHTDEPRIGENRALNTVEKESEGFLRELRQEGFFNSDEAFRDRLDGALAEIRSGAGDGVIRDNKQRGAVGGNWYQTHAELEFGIRRAWRNARKCIMRSHCEELRLCDLRNITSSAGIASKLMRNMSEAFNEGNVLPTGNNLLPRPLAHRLNIMTVFVFPPRQIDSRGPMIWNHQILEFAGYEMEDGSVLGDPNSVILTKSILELGWKPPIHKSRWDLLPLVVMADGDIPAMVEIPPELSKLVKIRHPRYFAEFERLDLKWVAFPALTRLGFDIGGVQYTAAPFIGWFMDAEIGVRDLADTFRYNALPDIAQALGLVDTEIEGIEGLDDLPEYERLSVLSRAQQELNYAVHWSYQQAKVSMSDTLTASMKWCRYDDEFKAKNGFRLPADPYWLAPPQGSIVPLWHRGGAPNYQPKPLICRHVQDPLKAWEREKQYLVPSAKLVHMINISTPRRPKLPGKSSSTYYVAPTPQKCDEGPPEGLADWSTFQKTSVLQTQASQELTPAVIDCKSSSPLSVKVFYCSAGTFAEKVATKLTKRLKDLEQSFTNISVCSQLAPLDELQASAIRPGSLVLLVISSTGQGEVPSNGSKFMAMCDKETEKRLINPQTSFRYAIYGNGDSRYAATYNGAAIAVDQKLRQIGGLSFAGGLYQGDTAICITALQALNSWWMKLRPAIQDLASDSPKLRRANSDDDYGKGPIVPSIDFETKARTRHLLRSEQLRTDYHDARVASIDPSYREHHPGTHIITLDLGAHPYTDMGCVQVLPINSPTQVRRALRALGVSGSSKAIPGTDGPSCSAFLTEYIDLESPFQNLEWLPAPNTTNISEERMRSSTSLDTLEYLHTLSLLPADAVLTTSICLALPQLHPRTYSIASYLSYNSSKPFYIPRRSFKAPTLQHRNHLDILVKPFPQGRFSHTFLSSSQNISLLRYRIVPSSAEILLTTPSTTPLIIVATGAGFAPVRCLLQRRIAESRSRNYDHKTGISLFLGFKPADVHPFSNILNEAAAAGALSSLSIVSSNAAGVRVYDRLLEDGTKKRLRELVVKKSGWVFICTNLEAAKSTRDVFEDVLEGTGGIDGMADRWVEEIF
ncbi:MAG: hypothetical protein Q9209_007642 [Squamulea sp. 1 TL-2023]